MRTYIYVFGRTRPQLIKKTAAPPRLRDHQEVTVVKDTARPVSCQWQAWKQRQRMRAIQPVTCWAAGVSDAPQVDYNSNKALRKGQSAFCLRQRQRHKSSSNEGTSCESLALPCEPWHGGLARFQLHYHTNVSVRIQRGDCKTNMANWQKDTHFLTCNFILNTFTSHNDL